MGQVIFRQELAYEPGEGIELEHGAGDEYIPRLQMPKIKITSDLTKGHLKQTKKEVLLGAKPY